jgi:hypothetical protein
MQNNLQSHGADEHWHVILDVSQTLLEAAAAAQWDVLEELAGRRDKLIRHYFSQPITVANALHIHDKITQLLAMDEQVLGLARQQQDKLLPVLAKMVRGKQAVSAYQQHSR